MLAWDDRPVHANTFTTYIKFTSIGIFAKASWLRNFTQSFTALPMLFKHFYGACLWRSLNSFYNDVSVFFFFFQGSLKEKQSPESLIVQENRWIFLCDMSAWEIWCEENSGPLNKILELKPAQFIEMFWFSVFKPVKCDTRCVLKFPLWRWRS